jgi:hypothetical protein
MSDLEVLLKLKSDSSQMQGDVKTARSVYTSELGQLVTSSNAAFRQIENAAASHFGVAGRVALAFTRSFTSATQAAQDETKKLSQASGAFESALVKAFSGGSREAKELGQTFERLGVSVEKGLRAPEQAFAAFLKAFRAIPNEVDRAALGVEVFGSKITQLLPALEGTATQSTAAAGGFAAMAGPVGIAVAAVAAITAATIGAASAIFSLTEKTATYGDEIYRAHQRTQLSTESLSALRLVSSENKVGFDQTTSAIDRYLKNVDEARLGNQKLAHELSDLGINVEQAARNPQEAIKQLLRAWSELGPTTDRNDDAIKLLGKSGDQLIPVLDSLQGSLDGAQKKAKTLGQLWSAEEAAQSHEFVVALKDLEAAASGLGATIGKKVVPDIIRDIKDLSRWLESNRERWEAWGATVRRVALGARMWFGMLGDIATGNINLLSNAAEQLVLSEVNANTPRHTDLSGAKGGSRALTKDDSKERAKAEREALKEAEDLAHARLNVLEIATREAERLYHEESEALKREFEARRISLQSYLAQEETAARRARDAKLAELAEERSVVEQTIVKATERQKRFADIAAKEQAARAEFNKKLLDDQATVQQKERAVFDEHRKAMLDLAAQRDAQTIAAIKDFERQRYITATEAEDRIISIEREGLNRRQLDLIEQLRLAGQNQEEQRKVNTQLQKLASDRVGFEENAVRRIAAARESDLANLRRYRAQLEAQQHDIAESELAAQRAEFENMKAGMLTREDLERIHTQALIDAEQNRFDITAEFRRKRQQSDERDARAVHDRALDAVTATQRLIELTDKNITAKQRAISDEQAALDKEKTRGDELKTTASDLFPHTEEIAESKRQQNAMLANIQTYQEELKQLNADLADATKRNEAARKEATDATGQIATLEQKGRETEQKSLADHNAKMQGLEAKREEVYVYSTKRIFATREEIIKTEGEFNEREIRLRHASTLTRLGLEKEALDAQLKDMQKAVDDGNTAVADLKVLESQIEAINRRIKAEQRKQDSEINQNTDETRKKQERADPSSRRSLGGDVFADTHDALKKQATDASKPISNLKLNLGSLAATAQDAFGRMSADVGNMASILSGAFGNIVAGLGETAAAYLETGELSGKAMAKMLVHVLASIAAQSLVKGVFETAESFASAAVGDIKAAVQHGTAATFYFEAAAIAGVAAVGARLLFGTAKDSGKGGVSAAGGALGYGNGAGGSDGPAQQKFNYGGATFPSSAVAGDGSRGGIGSALGDLIRQSVETNKRVIASNMLVAQNVAALHNKITSIPAHDLITANPYAVGDALNQAFESGHSVNRNVVSLGSTGRT